MPFRTFVSTAAAQRCLATDVFRTLRCVRHAWLLATVLCLATNHPLRAQSNLEFGSAENLGTVDVSDIRQASGVVASRENPGVLWTHNDSGDSARIFALSTEGKLLGIYTLPGATKLDYEDIALGPGPVPNVTYLYVGDIGDNNASRSEIHVYQIPEPAVYLDQSARPPTIALKGLRDLTLVYPDQAHNAEALMVDPLTGYLYIATKESGVSHVYRATSDELSADPPVTLTLVQEVFFDSVSGADISSDGRMIAFRQEDFARLWTRTPDQSVEDALAGEPIRIPVVGRPKEANGEAIGFDPQGNGYFTLSDSSLTQPVYYFPRTKPVPAPAPIVWIERGSIWKYLDTGTNLGSSWTASGFEDKAWKTGKAPLGYGLDPKGTTVSFGPKKSNRYITTYFRDEFNVDDPNRYEQVQLRLMVDDGAVVYLNGQVILNVNLPSSPLYNSLATTQQTDLESSWTTYTIDPSRLAAGRNVIAVEIHQASVDSTDLNFDLQILGWPKWVPETTAMRFTLDGYLELELRGPGATLNVETSTDLTHWFPLGPVDLIDRVGFLLVPDWPQNSQMYYRLLEP